MISLVQAFNDHSATFFVLATISVLVVGISRSGFEVGLGVLSLPLMASESSINEALVILLPLLIAIDLVGLRRFMRNADWRILKTRFFASSLRDVFRLLILLLNYTKNPIPLDRYHHLAIFNSKSGDGAIEYEGG